MIRTEAQLQLVLEELYKKICNCRRDDEEKEDLLNPSFHTKECMYRAALEGTDIEWKKKEEQTQDS